MINALIALCLYVIHKSINHDEKKKADRELILMHSFYSQEIRMKNRETNDTLRQEVLQLNNAKKVRTFLLHNLLQNLKGKISVHLCLVKA